MEPLREIGRLFLLIGAVFVIAGAFLYFTGKLPFRLGRLPGDISWHGKHTEVFFPVMTCIVVSVLITVAFWLISYFRK